MPNIQTFEDGLALASQVFQLVNQMKTDGDFAAAGDALKVLGAIGAKALKKLPTIIPHPNVAQAQTAAQAAANKAHE